MQLNLIFFISPLLLVNCKASDVGINLNPFSSNIGGYKVEERSETAALMQPSITSSALKSLAAIFAKGGNYIIDASSMGGGILIGKNGHLSPLATGGKGSHVPDGRSISSQLLQTLRGPALEKQANRPDEASSISSQLLQNIHGPALETQANRPDAASIASQLLQNLRGSALEKQANPFSTYSTNPFLKLFQKLPTKPQLISSPHKPNFFTARPVSTSVPKPMQMPLRKFKQVRIPQTVQDVNSLSYVMPDFSLLQFLDLHSSNYEGDFEF